MSANAAPIQPFSRWHQSAGERAVDWREALAPGCLAVFLNFHGEGEIVWKSAPALRIRPGAMVWVRGGGTLLRSAMRLAGRDRHECLALYFPDVWLAKTLEHTTTTLPGDLRPLVQHPFVPQGSASRPLTPEDRKWARVSAPQHLCDQARKLLDSTRLTEFLLRQLFERTRSPEEFCTRTKRIARERIEKVKAAVLEQLDEPPTLEELAILAGCNQHYLSRTFTQVEGLTLSLWLRRVRIERAASLISSGRCNVSEAAVEVGYRSFSHFSRAFFEEKGIQPSRWVGHLQAGGSGI